MTEAAVNFLAKPSVALGFGLFFICAATCAHFDEISSAPVSLVPDWVAGILLVSAAVISSRDGATGRAYQIAAWAFMVSLLFGSFVGNVEGWATNARDANGATGLVTMAQGPYVVIVGVLFGIALAGPVTTLRSRK
jgi:hypothetical protein